MAEPVTQGAPKPREGVMARFQQTLDQATNHFNRLTGQQPMRFDTYGRETPIAAMSRRDQEAMEAAGGAAGAIRFKPRGLAEEMLLGQASRRKMVQGATGPGESARAVGLRKQAAEDMAAVTRSIPKEEVQIIGAEPVFKSVHEPGWGTRVDQSVALPSGELAKIRTLSLNDPPTHVEWLGSSPNWRFSVAESQANHNALADFLLKKFGIKLEGLSAEPVSPSRAKLYRRQGWTGENKIPGQEPGRP